MSNADVDLAERHRSGDTTAFNEVYEAYSEMVFNVALRMCGNLDEASDISQEAFIKVNRYLGGFRGRSSLRTWIYRVAVNSCRSRFRKQNRWQSRVIADGGEQLESMPGTDRSPEERAIARGTMRLLSAALMQLPAIFREAVVLRDVEGLTYDEIAAVLGVRIGTVRSRIARGRDRLRTILEEQS